jgi:PEP-CTERM motif
MRKVLVLAVLVLGAVCSYAGSTDYTFLAYSGGNWQNGYPYYITNGPAGAITLVMCDDYAHGGNVGNTWEANITNLGSGNLNLTRFNKFVAGPNALAPLTLYDEAGWILLQTITTPEDMWKDMNYAVWHIFDPNSPLDQGAEGWLMAAQQEAKIGFPGVDFNKVYIITPVDQYNPDLTSMQEFLMIGQDPTDQGRNSGAQTPEPGTLVLLGTGVLAVFRRKFFS